MMIFITFILFSLISFSVTEPPPYRRVCYYHKWSLTDGLTPDKVNAHLCTHYIYGFSWIKDGVMVMEGPDDEQRYQQLFTLKNRAPGIKIMLSLGSSLGDLKLSNAVTGEANRTRLADSILDFLNKYKFDGLDIDWEFPAWIFSGAPPKDKNNFLLLLKELRKRFDENTPRLLLSVAAGASYTIVKMSYNIPEMAKYVDFINLMTYGLNNYQWYTPFTGHNSPLFKREGQTLLFATMNTLYHRVGWSLSAENRPIHDLKDNYIFEKAWAVEYFINHGMPKEKVMVGLGTYGNGYTLSNPNKHDVGSLATSGFDGPNYREICQMLQQGATRVFDNQAKVPYLYKDKKWVSYDDEESFTIKCNWVKQNELGGVMTWNLNHDDWNQTCGGKPFPLHGIIYDILS